MRSMLSWKELGGYATFGRTLRTEDDLRVAIREGFPQTVVEETMRSADLTLKQLAKTLSLSPRSLQRGAMKDAWRGMSPIVCIGSLVSLPWRNITSAARRRLRDG